MTSTQASEAFSILPPAPHYTGTIYVLHGNAELPDLSGATALRAPSPQETQVQPVTLEIQDIEKVRRSPGSFSLVLTGPEQPPASLRFNRVTHKLHTASVGSTSYNHRQETTGGAEKIIVTYKRSYADADAGHGKDNSDQIVAFDGTGKLIMATRTSDLAEDADFPDFLHVGRLLSSVQSLLVQWNRNPEMREGRDMIERAWLFVEANMTGQEPWHKLTDPLDEIAAQTKALRLGHVPPLAP